jgi:hypothetical protein
MAESLIALTPPLGAAWRLVAAVLLCAALDTLEAGQAITPVLRLGLLALAVAASEAKVVTPTSLTSL